MISSADIKIPGARGGWESDLNWRDPGNPGSIEVNGMLVSALFLY